MKKWLWKRMTVKLDVYDECKYTASQDVFDREKRVEVDGVVAFDVATGKEAKALEAFMDEEDKDLYHEYLILYREEGHMEIYRNSYVDMFLR